MHLIYTVTFNPSLDYIVSVDRFMLGTVNRTKDELVYAGGKGINVSLVLKNLGINSTAYGFVAGFTGNEIERILTEKGVNTNLIKVKDGMSRINVKLRSQDETEINGQGPNISDSDIENLYKSLENVLKEGDILVLAGSIPDTISKTAYSDIMNRIKNKNVKIIVDATRELLVNVLSYHPFLIKPNNYELGEILGVKINTRADAAVYGKRLLKMGAKNVLVSMAGEGAVLITEDGQVFESAPPEGTVVNSVGAGDSMVAGFITGYLRNKNYYEALQVGLCTGSASAFSENLATKDDVNKLLLKFGKGVDSL